MNLKMFKEKITFSLPCLKSLVASKTSCVYCKPNFKRSLTIQPIHFNNLKESVREILGSKVTTYDIELGGIILSYKNVKINCSVEMNDEGQFNLDYVADIYLFTPQIGSILNGRINKKGRDVLGCLVHSVFNVALPRPRFDEENSAKKWIGSKAYMGQNVTFSVVKLNFTGRLPYIKGQILSLENDGLVDDEGADSGMGFQESNDDDGSIKGINVLQNSKIKENLSPHSLKRKRSLDDCLTISPIVKKKKCPVNSSDEGLSGEELLNTDTQSSSGKKNKLKHKNSLDNIEGTSQIVVKNILGYDSVTVKEEPPDDTFTSPKPKKKKKDKHSRQSSLVIDLENLSSSLLTEALAKVKTENVSEDDEDFKLMNSKLSEIHVPRKNKKNKHSNTDLSENFTLKLSETVDKNFPETDVILSQKKIKKRHKERSEQNSKEENKIEKGNSEMLETKKKKKTSQSMNEISSALLEEAVKSLSVKVENVKKEDYEPTTDSGTVKKPSKKIKSKMDSSLDLIKDKLLEETLNANKIENKKNKLRQSSIEDIFENVKKKKKT